jgi:hypothetical protein
MAARARTLVKDKVAARPGTTAAKGKIRAKEKADAKPPRTAAKGRMAALLAGVSRG